ncbi:putative baseplate assembly protein [Streptomyces harbinensis]|uniref:putative baseplate assembly protein n=1 Tax=Streptomyces harbinensis TaxID=1176198 RepID=UPI0036A1310C
MTSLPSPNLDDRRFQGLVDEAKRLVQQRCPEWTDHNVSDPGVTLIEAFATMVDQLVYRLNRVPDKNYLTFLDLIGVRLYPPTAARVPVTFTLSAPQPEPVRIRAGTQVATVRGETEEAVVFSTVRELSVPPCTLEHLVTWPAGGEAADRTQELALERDVPCFSGSVTAGAGAGGTGGAGAAAGGTAPAPGDCLYIGLSDPVPGGVVVLRLDCRVDGVGVDPRRPPLRWEAWDGAAWAGCEVEADGTGGFNKAGDIVLHLPDVHASSRVARHEAGWLRCRLIEAAEGQPAYRASPTVRAARAFTIGGRVEAVHAETVTGELLGASDGLPGQSFQVARPPVVPGEEPFVVEVSEGTRWREWRLVESFAHSTVYDRHVTLDRNAGRIDFGPAVREADGGLRVFGAIPPKGGAIRVRSYRTGGGRRGNVARGALRVLRSSLPYVARVTNRAPALGGVDGETVENARVRGPLTLRTLHRAVVPRDYEQLAREVAPEVARVHCVRAGEQEGEPLRLLVVPGGHSDARGRVAFDDLVPSPETLAAISDHLDERRPVGARLLVQPPLYQGLTIVASLQSERGVALDRLRETALTALYSYFNPLTGGPEGRGWPFGRPVQSGEVFAVLQRVPGVDLVEDIRLFPADPLTGERTEPVSRIELDAHALVFSYGHQLRVREGG